MVFRLLSCAALAATLAFAGWPRYVSGNGKGRYTDAPPSHPLAYFKADPCLRPAGDSLVEALDCTWAGKPPATPEERKSWASTQADLVEVGKIASFTIYDLWYQRTDFDVRSVLVETGTDQYREINVQVRQGQIFPRSEIVKLDREPILIVKFHDGGNAPYIYEMQYMFRASGVVAPDFSAVGATVAKLKPSNMSGVIDKNDYASMTYTLELYRNDTNLPRVAVTERGRITVSYRFADGRAVVTSSKYEPYSKE